MSVRTRRPRAGRSPLPAPSGLRRAASAWFDPVLALVAAVGAVVTVVVPGSGDPYDFRDADALAVTLALVSAVPLAWRRRYPVGGHVVLVSGPWILGLLDYGTGVTPLLVFISVYTLAAYGQRPRAFWGVGYLAVVLLSLTAAQAYGFEGLNIVFTSVVYGGAWYVGDLVRSRRLRLEAAEERAGLLERERDEEARRAVAEERLRLAQELHDVVAHAMSVIAVQSGVAAHVIDRDPDAARRALRAVEETSRSALAELRRMLGVLRQDDQPRDVLAPTPTLEEIRVLGERFREVGMDVEITVDVPAGAAVPDSMQLNAYRIVQESLTNVLKHAGRATATVVVRLAEDRLELEVADDGRGASASPDGRGTGHGLVGMRERVALFGGRLDAGPRPGGGYRVLASLPLERPRTMAP